MLKKYHVHLQAPMSDSFRGVRAANSLDMDVKAKSIHELSVEADLESPFHVGLIVGASGSGKSTLARQVYGEFHDTLDLSKAVIDQFPKEMSYDECAAALSGIGLSSVPCWLKPAGALSNGQRARASAALALAFPSGGTVVIDEWTSVVDRTVAKVMSHCVQKIARRTGRKLVLVSCHYDVVDWLDPDWIVDCNSQTFTDRRSLRRGRTEKLQFEIREVTSRSWARFSKYHYLSAAPIGGRTIHFGLFHGGEQIGYACLANYTPWSDKSKPMIMHATRIVVHPDFAGFGLGVHFANALAARGTELGYRVLIKFSSTPLYKLLSRDPRWRLMRASVQIGRVAAGGNMDRGKQQKNGKSTGFRENVKTYSFEWLGKT